MEDEVTEPIDTSTEGGAPAPAGDAAPPAIQDGEGGNEPADDADGGDPTPDGEGSPDGEGGGEGAPRPDKNDDPKHLRKRVDALTAKRKEQEARIEALQKRVDAFESERSEREMADLRGLPVVPESLSSEERSEVKRLRAELSDQERARDFWARHGEGDEDVTVSGRSYTPEQCRRFARMSDRDAGRIEGRIDAILDSGRRRLSALMRKHGKELFGEGAGEDTPPPVPPKAPPRATPKAPPKAPPPRAPERAPGASRAPGAADGAAPPKAAARLAQMSQADFEAEFEEV